MPYHKVPLIYQKLSLLRDQRVVVAMNSRTELSTPCSSSCRSTFIAPAAGCCDPRPRAAHDNPAYHFKRIGLEPGPLWQWLFSALAEAGLPVICVETRHMQAVLKAQINKTDRNDARGIAQMMRAGLYRPVHRKGAWAVTRSPVLMTASSSAGHCLALTFSQEVSRNRAIPFAATDFVRAFPRAQTSLQQESIARAGEPHLRLDADLPIVPRHRLDPS